MSLIVDNVVHFKESANVAYREALDLIAGARNWAQGMDIDITDAKAAEAEVYYRQAKLAEMERSLLSNLVHLMTGPQAHDGPITVTRDMEASFFWHHEKSGYHGGLIFHQDSRPADVRVGTWSIHT